MKKEFLSRPITKKYYENYDAAFGKKLFTVKEWRDKGVFVKTGKSRAK